jgi:squalene synthase HpnC
VTLLLADAPPGVPAAATVMARVGGENFPVASRVLPRAARAHLLALYGFARLVDELGDADADERPPDECRPDERRLDERPPDERRPAERLAALDWLQGELAGAYAGRAAHPLLVRLQPTLRACALPRAPFLALIEANRVDQRVARYETWEQLLGYCALSANPVGQLVLGVFGKATPERVALSDRICTALQLAEHWQDVAEDYARGRIYLPAEDRARFGCEEEELASARGDQLGVRGGERAGATGSWTTAASWRLRGLLAFEVARTRDLLAEGLPLIATLRGRERLAVAAFAGGACAALDAIEDAGYDVLAGPPRASHARRAAATARLLARVR